MTDEERREHECIASRKYRATHPEEVGEYNATYYKTHARKDAEYGAHTHKTHPEKAALRQARYHKTHPEKWTKYYRDHLEAMAKTSREWTKAHREERRLSLAKRRSLKYSNTPISEMLTSTEWLAILAEANGHCAYCGKEAKLTLDHVIPLSKGGKHSKENVVPACLHCNSSKGNRTLEEWNAKRLTEAKQ